MKQLSFLITLGVPRGITTSQVRDYIRNEINAGRFFKRPDGVEWRQLGDCTVKPWFPAQPVPDSLEEVVRRAVSEGIAAAYPPKSYLPTTVTNRPEVAVHLTTPDDDMSRWMQRMFPDPRIDPETGDITSAVFVQHRPRSVFPNCSSCGQDHHPSYECAEPPDDDPA
jgi:hypothetical protein